MGDVKWVYFAETYHEKSHVQPILAEISCINLEISKAKRVEKEF